MMINFVKARYHLASVPGALPRAISQISFYEKYNNVLVYSVVTTRNKYKQIRLTDL